MTLDLTNPKQRRQAEHGVAEKISVEIIPHLFHDPERKAWIRLPIDDRYETYAVDSEEIADFLKQEFWERMKSSFGVGMPMPAKLLKERLEFLTYKARYDGAEHSVFMRVGKNDHILYVDLCDDKWRTVRIGPDGWEIEDQPQVYFHRARGMMPLPIPERGGSLDELAPFLNISSDQFILVKGWLLAALRSGGTGTIPYPLMVPIGTEGSAKTTFSKMLRALVDPNSIPTVSPPEGMRDLAVNTLSSHVLAFDNISELSRKLSDALCRLSTGGGNIQRQMYTNQGQSRFPDISRPIILNGLADFIDQPDLLDRAIVLHLGHIANKQTEADIWRRFADERGRIFGGLLDLMVKGVRNLPSVPSANQTRMADFVQWCIACGLIDFESRYQQNLKDNVLASIEHDELAKAVNSFMESRKEPWEGTMGALEPLLLGFGYQARSLSALSGQLKKIAPALRSGLGIVVEELPRRSEMRGMRISQSPSSASSAS